MFGHAQLGWGVVPQLNQGAHRAGHTWKSLKLSLPHCPQVLWPRRRYRKVNVRYFTRFGPPKSHTSQLLSYRYALNTVQFMPTCWAAYHHIQPARDCSEIPLFSPKLYLKTQKTPEKLGKLQKKNQVFSQSHFLNFTGLHPTSIPYIIHPYFIPFPHIPTSSDNAFFLFSNKTL